MIQNDGNEQILRPVLHIVHMSRICVKHVSVQNNVFLWYMYTIAIKRMTILDQEWITVEEIFNISLVVCAKQNRKKNNHKMCHLKI